MKIRPGTYQYHMVTAMLVVGVPCVAIFAGWFVGVRLL